jgi:hypothetical protein
LIKSGERNTQIVKSGGLISSTPNKDQIANFSRYFDKINECDMFNSLELTILSQNEILQKSEDLFKKISKHIINDEGSLQHNISLLENPIITRISETIDGEDALIHNETEHNPIEIITFDRNIHCASLMNEMKDIIDQSRQSIAAGRNRCDSLRKDLMTYKMSRNFSNNSTAVESTQDDIIRRKPAVHYQSTVRQQSITPKEAYAHRDLFPNIREYKPTR